MFPINFSFFFGKTLVINLIQTDWFLPIVLTIHIRSPSITSSDRYRTLSYILKQFLLPLLLYMYVVDACGVSSTFAMTLFKKWWIFFELCIVCSYFYLASYNFQYFAALFFIWNVFYSFHAQFAKIKIDCLKLGTMIMKKKVFSLPLSRSLRLLWCWAGFRSFNSLSFSVSCH